MTAPKAKTNPYGLRAPAKLMVKVRKRAAKEHVSLSVLVHAIFVDYVISPDRDLGLDFSNLALGQTLPLPSSAVRSLLEMRGAIHDVGRGEARFNAYLAALNAGGWSMQSVAQSLGMTRQAVSLRVKKVQGVDFDDLPDVPARSPYARARTRLPSDKVLFAVRLDPALHADVRVKAKREGAGITAILVGGLKSYVAGTLTVHGKGDDDDR